MEVPAGYQTSVKFRATGSLPPSHLDSTGKSIGIAADVQDSSKEVAVEKSLQVEEKKDKKAHCIDLLVEGCVDSFVDLLKITQAEPVSEEGEESAASSSDGGKKPAGTKQATDIVFLKESLERAESNRRSKNYNLSVEGYQNLAEYFDQLGSTSSSRYFYQRCIAVAQEAGQSDAIAKANLNLGMCEEKLGHWEAAMSYHETALELSTEANVLPLVVKAAFHLCQVYKVLAEKFLKGNPSPEDIRASSDLFEKCVACAKLAKDNKLEGQNCHQLGKVKILSGEYEESIRLQKQYLDICSKQGDRAGEANARAALAQAYEALGNAGEAILQLELLLTVAAEAGEVESQAQACT
mmetsp:Transcript_12791/g.31098  ORF Transcript_12791/g.31098 Transcript_12791/m.31098 type:complete len:352 (-) Transcript_12791:800-1855(-)